VAVLKTAVAYFESGTEQTGTDEGSLIHYGMRVEDRAMRRRITHGATFGERLAEEARRLKEFAAKVAPGREREEFLRKVDIFLGSETHVPAQ
jgi:hypothetical protein